MARQTVPPGPLAIGSASDTGAVREHNEDAVGFFQIGEGGWLLLLVCDGMGGHRAGDRASAMAIEHIGQAFSDRIASLGPAEALEASIQHANAAIHAAGTSNPEWGGMGTTCVALAVRGTEGYLAHVGDSRAYGIRGDRIRRLTQDHTAVRRMVEAGMLTEAEGDAHPNAGVLERCLGPAPEVEVEVQGPMTLKAGDRLILCSDGIYGPMDDALLAAMAVMYEPQEAAEKLIRLSIERGGDDNASLQILHVTGAAAATGRFEPERFRPKPPAAAATARTSSGGRVAQGAGGHPASFLARRIGGVPVILALGLGLFALVALGAALTLRSGEEAPAPERTRVQVGAPAEVTGPDAAKDGGEGGEPVQDAESVSALEEAAQKEAAAAAKKKEEEAAAAAKKKEAVAAQKKKEAAEAAKKKEAAAAQKKKEAAEAAKKKTEPAAEAPKKSEAPETAPKTADEPASEAK